MKRVCAWCGKDMGEIEPLDDDSITHGICDDCLLRNFPHIYELVYGDRTPEEVNATKTR